MLYGGGGFRVEGQVWCALTQWVKCVCVCCEGRTSSTTRHKVKWNFCAEWCYSVDFCYSTLDMQGDPGKFGREVESMCYLFLRWI